MTMIKKYYKKAIGVVLVLAICLVSTVVPNTTKVKAATRNDAVSWANAQIDKGLDYDGVYGNQCVDLIKYYYAYFGYGNYAMGNANAYITNNLPPGWTRVYSGFQPGDIAVWKVNHSCGTCNTGGYGHVGIITSADNTGFNAVNQNFNSKSYCTQNWFYCSALACAIRPSYSNPPASTSVSFTDFKQNGISDTNAEFYIKVNKSGDGKITNVGCYLYDENGNLLKSYRENCSYANWCNYVCNMNTDMGYTLKPGTTYKYVLCAVANGKEFKDTMRSFKTTGYSDNEKPTISDVSIYDVSESGYKVKCKANDNTGVVRVQFPTWTDANGQDDIQSEWWSNPKASGTLTNGYYVYEVKTSDHKNELGIYHTHIYAYDKAGNYVCVAASDTKLEKKQEQTTPPTMVADANRLASVGEQEYNVHKGQQYNYQYGSSPWCCNFVSWCARQAGLSTDVIKSTATVQTMYDNLINACGAKVVTTPQRGDLVFYKYTDYDSARFHHIGIMTSATESVQGNVNNTWWKGNPWNINNIKELVYVRLACDGKYVAPNTAYFDAYNLNKVEDTNAEVYIKCQNPNREKVTSFGCELYDENGILLYSYTENCDWSTSYVNYTCNFNVDMGYKLSPCTKYQFKLFGIVGGKRLNDVLRSFTTTGVKNNAMEEATTKDENLVQDTPASEKNVENQEVTQAATPKDNYQNNQSSSETTLKKPPKVKGLSLYSSSKKIFASWRFDTSSNRTGYQIQYASNKSFTKNKKTKNVGYYTTDLTISKLKKKKVYYVRVRGINKNSSSVKYGSWSTAKKVTIKK